MKKAQREVLVDYLTKVMDEIFVRQERNGMVASGYSKANTKVEETKKGAALSGPLYLRTNFKGIGRKPGTMPPVKSIEAWLKMKNLEHLSAWAVAMNIKKNGTRIYWDKRRGIDVQQILGKFKKEFLDNLAKSYKLN